MVLFWGGPADGAVRSKPWGRGSLPLDLVDEALEEIKQGGSFNRDSFREASRGLHRQPGS